MEVWRSGGEAALAVMERKRRADERRESRAVRILS